MAIKNSICLESSMVRTDLYTLKYLLSIMGNANIDEGLKSQIESFLKETKYKIRYQNLKGFIDNACMNELNKLQDEERRD